MFKDSKLFINGLFTLLVFSLSASVWGQDLGSSNGLFRASNPKTRPAETTSAAKKPTAKPRAVKAAPKKAVVAKASPKRNSREKAPLKSNGNPRRPTTASRVIEPAEDVIIKVGSKSTGEYSELFEQAIDEGNAARDLREYGKAEASYLRAKNINPRDSRSIYGLGNIYSDQQRWEVAEKYYRQAISLDSSSADPYIAMSFVLTQPIIGKELSNRFIEAEKFARQAISLDAENPFAYDQLGVALELNGKIGAETKNTYLKAIEIDPEFALAYAHLGRLLRRSGKIKESNEAYAKAIKFSGDAPTQILVADVLQSQQRFGDSEQLLRRALREDSKNPSALFLLGRALTTRGEYSEAETVLKKSVEISPNSFVSYVLLGSLYTRRGDFDDAEKTLNSALKVISENERKNLAVAFESVGDGYLKKGKKNDAARVYRQAVALDKTKPSLTQKIARAQM